MTKEEVEKALQAIKKNKSPGTDNVPVELLKNSGDEGIRVLTSLCQRIWDTRLWPEDWKSTVYIPIPKKGDPRDCADYRTIAQISHASKILLKVIQGRMEQLVKRELPDVQAGFVKGRGTRDQIANVRWMWERAREYNQSVYLCFIDYSKAFDCVDHNVLWNTLRSMGVSEHLIDLQRNLYEGQTATVRTEYGSTERFRIEKGVRQGCILSPTLFNLYAERIMREAGLEESDIGVRVGGRVLNNLRYADDTTLISETEDGLKMLVENVTKAGEKAGLQLNIKKTKVMSNAGLSSFRTSGGDIEVVQKFNLLGAVLEEEGTCSSEVNRRMALGRAVMIGLSRIWKDRNIRLVTKSRLVKALVFPVATYGCEAWTHNKAQKAKLTTFEMWCWRRMLRVPWTARRTNASVLEEVGHDTMLELKVLRIKLSYFGHVVRGDGLEKAVMLGMGNGSRSRGRPRRRWLDELLEITGLRLQALIEAAGERDGWRRLVHVVTRGRPRPDGTR